ncbi:MAG TPA: TM0106 family RecB-like putative nuclease [Polyangiaceae bacterium]|nr:TM0106 family RecB-like putative nuclease [Polyangiaceae bacterium]
MRNTPSGTGFSATDLSHFLECGRRTSLDLLVLDNKLDRPGQNDIQRRLLERRGVAHEARVLDHYRRSGKNIVTITAQPGAEGTARAAEETIAAMKAGAEVIYQAALSHENWAGRPDFLVRADGADHYEVVDAKLSRETKARAVLQLCVYTDHLARQQGVTPKYFYIAGGKSDGEPDRLLVADYQAYYRAVRQRFDAFTALEDAEAPYPEPVEHCGICPWWKRCEEKRRADDHLSLVAGITRRQRDRLTLCGVRRVSELAALGREQTVEGVARESLARVREQARIQIAGRAEGKPLHELLPDADPGTGLEALPPPTAGDLFLDLEGDSFAFGDGLEYLFGLVDLGEPVIDSGFDFSERAPGPPRYHAFWASDPASEKLAFEQVIDRIMRGRDELPRLHVYHFGHRESDALKKLSCRHKTREAEVDTLLREHVLVDLHAVVRQALRASVEGYTLKQLEGLYAFARGTELRSSAEAMQLFGWWLETGDTPAPLDELRARIQSYNQDDCISTLGLRDFLERLRPELERQLGRKLARPSTEPAKATEQSEKSKIVAEVSARLHAARPDDPAHRLLADLLEWHWREAKSGYWEYFRALAIPPHERLADRSVLAGLDLEGEPRPLKQSLVYRYVFPPQEHAVRTKPQPDDPDTEKSAGEVVAIGETFIELKRGKRNTAPHPRALVPGGPMQTKAHEESLLALGEAVARNPDGDDFRAARELLRRQPPRVGQAPDEPLVRPGESVEDALARLALALDGSVMAVQGPPGSGKTHQAALMILSLIRAGKRVGVTANSHAVIKNVLKKVAELGSARTLHLQDDDDSDDDDPYPFEINNDKPRAHKRLLAGELDLVGGTSWTWASERFAESLDVLVVDEAGQMSLANVLAVSRAAKSLVLFGDPAQLEQPQKGVHPPGAEVSALEHLLGDALTIPAERGVFLPHTRRLHPLICDFVSRVFYEGRLEPQAGLGLERQSITGSGTFSGSGLRFVPVAHDGNSNHSPEEIELITRIVTDLLASKAASADDVLIVAPYNAQVAALKRALPNLRVGTVDKFQGQEAPVVIYSMTTSTADEAPRGLEFLYSTNRLNVAVSRAKALCIVVGNPELARVSCKTPRQMKLVNALCAYLEAAR